MRSQIVDGREGELGVIVDVGRERGDHGERIGVGKVCAVVETLGVEAGPGSFVHDGEDDEAAVVAGHSLDAEGGDEAVDGHGRPSHDVELVVHRVREDVGLAAHHEDAIAARAAGQGVDPDAVL